MVEAFNEVVKCNPITSNSDIEINKSLIKMWHFLVKVNQGRNVALNIRQITSKNNNNDAKSGIVIEKPANTAEYRVPPCPRNGDEAIRISRLLEALFKTVHQDMIERKELTYHPEDPAQLRDESTLLDKMKIFSDRTGFDLDDLRRLRRGGGSE